MGFRIGAYAKIWEVNKAEKYTKVRLTTSKKNKQTNEYETDFNSYVMLLGRANTIEISVNDTIKISECEVTTKYDKVKSVKYTNYAIFDCEIQQSNQQGSPQAQGYAKATEPSRPASTCEMKPVLETDLPF